ncbi:MAG: biopolymer transporter ExbD [Spirochaetaceae bacterium]|nr:biopolymer transporter ExbD [Spirochaetaceae bacterium]
MKERRGLKPQTSVNLVPMIDVVFQLVIFFMVSTTFKVVPGIELDLPESRTAEAVTLTPLVLSVGGRDEIYVNDREVTLGGLEGALRDVVGGENPHPEEHPVVVEGDSAVPYDLMVDVLDVLRVLGFHAASLRTRDPNAPRPGG